MARLGLGRTAPEREGRLNDLSDRIRAYGSKPVGSLLRRTVPADSKMEVGLPNDYRRPRERGPGANAAASQALESRFRGNDE